MTTRRRPATKKVKTAKSATKPRIAREPKNGRRDHALRRRRPVTDCCTSPSLAREKTLVSTSRRDLVLHRCEKCGAWWLIEHEEIAMNSNFDELHFEKYAPLTADEAAVLTPETTDFTFLDERPVLRSVQEGVLEWRTGWNGLA